MVQNPSSPLINPRSLSLKSKRVPCVRKKNPHHPLPTEPLFVWRALSFALPKPPPNPQTHHHNPPNTIPHLSKISLLKYISLFYSNFFLFLFFIKKYVKRRKRTHKILKPCVINTPYFLYQFPLFHSFFQQLL